MGQYWINVGGNLGKLTEARFQHMLDNQGGKCLICMCDIVGDDAKGRALAMVDHDHAKELVTGKMVVRGLLCRRCNLLLGFIEATIPLFPQMLEYLEVHNTEPSKDLLDNIRVLRLSAERYLSKYGAAGGSGSV